jgi:SAM-dependent methyltransferase
MTEDSVKSEPTRYDPVLYPGYSHSQTHPDRLWLAGRLFGMKPAAINSCRVLEIGCGRGSNLIPIAWSLPGSEFVGVDLANRPISLGNQMILETGLRNVRLEQGDLLEIGPDWGKFDYIIAHGVFSWIPPGVREGLLRVCRDCLTPQGIAFVSYSAFPGAHVKNMLREMMLYHVNACACLEPDMMVEEALDFVGVLAEAGETKSEWRGWIQNELKRILEYEPGHLFHDELAPIHQPFSLTQFVEAARENGLQYLGEADYLNMRARGLSARTEKKVSEWSADRVQQEQYLDFLTLRQFRETLLCHSEVEVCSQADPKAILACRVYSKGMRTECDRLTLGERMKFEASNGLKIETDFTPGVAALQILAEVGVEGIQGEELVIATRRRLQAAGIGGQEENIQEGLPRFLLDLYGSRLLELRARPAPGTRAAGERPFINPVVRWQAQHGINVTSCFHVGVQIEDEVTRQLLLLLDGTRNREALLKDLHRALASDSRNSAPNLASLKQNLDANLGKLAAIGLLAG